MKQAELGDHVQCVVTGLKGIVTTIATSLYGCDRLVLQPSVEKDNKVPESQWVDITGVKVIKKGVVKGHKAQERSELGGPTLKMQTPRKMP